MFQDNYNDNGADKDWRLHVWGVRSNAPASGKDYMAYGCHTACISVKIRNEMLIFDAGSGIAELGKSLAAASENNSGSPDTHDDSMYGISGSGMHGDPMSDMSPADFMGGMNEGGFSGSGAYTDDMYDELIRGLEAEAGISGDFTDESFTDMPSFGSSSFPENDMPLPFDGIESGAPGQGLPFGGQMNADTSGIGMNAGNDIENMLLLQEYEKNKQKEDTPRVFHIFLSSLRLDTLSSLMTFLSFYDEKAVIHIYGCDMGGMNIAEALSVMFKPPFWPVTAAEVPAMIYFHRVIPGEGFVIGSLGLLVSAVKGHDAVMFRIDEGGAMDDSRKKCLVYSSACGPEAWNADELRSFLSGAVLAVCDSAFSPEELFMRSSYGHSSWKSWLSVLAGAGVQNALMLRYSDEYTDDIIKNMADNALALAGRLGINSIFAREGMDIVL